MLPCFSYTEKTIVSDPILGYPDPNAGQFILDTEPVIMPFDVFYPKLRKTVRE